MKRRIVHGAGGVPLSVLHAGDRANPAILFIHGWSQAALSWSRQFAALADRFFLVAPDLRGHGASGKPDAASAYDTPQPWADDIAAVIAAFGLNRPVIVGWSMGGYIVQDYLSVHGDGGVSGIVLIGTGVTKGAFLPEAARAFRGANPAVVADGMLDEDPAVNIAATLAFIRACTAQPMDRESYAEAAAFNMACPPHIRAVARQRPEDYRAAMARMRVPVMVAWGDLDPFCHSSMVAQMLETIPTAEPREYKGSAHMPFFEDSETFNADLAAFTERCAACVA